MTHGAHAASWVGPELQRILAVGLGSGTTEALIAGEPIELGTVWPAGLWAAHQAQKGRLVELVAARTGRQLDPEALLLGFAPSEGGSLLMDDPERLAALLTAADRPVQLVFAGKVHPRDEAGKAALQDVVRFAARPELRQGLVVIPDCDIAGTRALVQGVDVWVHVPRLPRGSSGPPGQKVAMNGGLICSTLDGWWVEAHRTQPLAGWAVGSAGSSADERRGDRDSAALFEVLEEEMVPCFYERDDSGIPSAWIERMYAAIETCVPAFNTHRMLADYAAKVYIPE